MMLPKRGKYRGWKARGSLARLNGAMVRHQSLGDSVRRGAVNGIPIIKALDDEGRDATRLPLRFVVRSRDVFCPNPFYYP
jgi:hypothetical protein